MGRSSTATALTLVVLTFIECEAATQYVVGNGKGWTAPPNITAGFYDKWAASKSFEGNDALVFEFNGTHSLAAVSKEEYDSCAKVFPICDGTNGFSCGYQIPRKAGVYYFICTVDSHCEAGQKLAINVTSAGFATWSPPSPVTSSALSTVLYSFAFFLLGH